MSKIKSKDPRVTAGLKAMHKEMNQQIIIYTETHALNVEAAIMWQLHTQLGFGKKRLKRFHDKWTSEYDNLKMHYIDNQLLDEYDILVKLGSIGVNLKEWNKKEGV